MIIRSLMLLLATTAAASAQSYRVALVTKGNSNEYWKTVHAGAVKAARELTAQGVTVRLLWAAPSSESASAEQSTLVNGFVTQHVNGIVLAPTDVHDLGAPVEAAAQAGVPTVVIDSGLKTNSMVSFISTDNYKGGFLGGLRVGAVVGGKGSVVLFRFLRHSAGTEARESGFLDVIKGRFQNITVVDSIHYSGATYDAAHASAAALLQSQATPPDAIFCSNDISAVGMLQALREAHLAGGKVKLVVFDSSAQTLDGLKAGDIQGLIVQNPFLMGYTGVQTLVAHLSGKPVDHEIDTGCRLVTNENLATPEIDALIHPPVDQYAD